MIGYVAGGLERSAWDPGIPSVARDLLHSFRVPQTEVSEIIWFAIGAMGVALLFRGAFLFERHFARRRAGCRLPAIREGRRRHYRVPVRLPVRVALPGPGRPVRGTITDISAEGAALLLDRAIPEKTCLTLSLAVERRDEILAAEIIGSAPHPQGRMLRCRFVAGSSGRRQHLARLAAGFERARIRFRRSLVPA